MDKTYCVYEHVFPDGKRYIGITCSIERRWRNGFGYRGQDKVFDAICKHGWDNIQHNVIVDGLNKEQAQVLEKYLIDALDTIRNGYNVSIGGNEPIGTYFKPYVLEMIAFVRKHPKRYHKTTVEFVDDIYKGRFKKDFCSFVNDATDAIIKKHREFSTQDEVDVMEFWFCMDNVFKLRIMIANGEDVSDWKEKSMWEVIWEQIMQA